MGLPALISTTLMAVIHSTTEWLISAKLRALY